MTKKPGAPSNRRSEALWLILQRQTIEVERVGIPTGDGVEIVLRLTDPNGRVVLTAWRIPHHDLIGMEELLVTE